MSLVVTTRLGPYEILSPLGAGGMGEVYRAKDTRLGREVAIKVLPEEFAKDPDRLARFEREAKAVAAFSHPNILALYDVGIKGSTHYAVLELLEGETLRERLSAGAIPVRKAVEWAAHAAKGLAAAHDKGIVHRDLKPENLFLTKDGQIKILDFGLASHPSLPDSTDTKSPTVTRHTEPGTLLGTVGYMSPEQVRGKPADPRSDIFSLGTILYEMLSGQRAFQGESQADVLSAILKEDPKDLQELSPVVPERLSRVIYRCLEKDPASRFQSACDLAFSLEEASGTSATGAGVTKGWIRVSRQRTVWVWPSIAVLLLLGALAAWWVVLTRKEAPPAIPQFQRLTFRPGTIERARFTPGGQNVVFSAAWNGGPTQIYMTGVNGNDAVGVDLKANLLAVSPQNELAIQLSTSLLTGFPIGMLARAPLGGASPRDILENVQEADWDATGREMAVLRQVEASHWVIEYPIGNIVLDTPRPVTGLRVSPDGKWLAALEGGALILIDRGGAKRSLAEISGFQGLAWTSDGTTVRFASLEPEGGTGLWSVALSGKRRLLYRAAGSLKLHDEGPSGDLLGVENRSSEVIVQAKSGEEEQNLSWLDASVAISLTSDGRTLLLNEYCTGSESVRGYYLRHVDGTPPVKLGEGEALDLSKDGTLVLASVSRNPVGVDSLMIVPTGAGQTKLLKLSGFDRIWSAWFFPDGARFLIHGALKGEEERFFAVTRRGGKPVPITPSGTSHWAYQKPLSPDGRTVCAFSGNYADYKVMLYPVDGGTPRPLNGYVQGDVIAGWSADGRYVYAFRRDELPAQVVRYEVSTGKREFWRKITPTNPTGVSGIRYILLTPDASTLAYGYNRILQELYLAKGLR